MTGDDRVGGGAGDRRRDTRPRAALAERQRGCAGRVGRRSGAGCSPRSRSTRSASARRCPSSRSRTSRTASSSARRSATYQAVSHSVVDGVRAGRARALARVLGGVVRSPRATSRQRSPPSAAKAQAATRRWLRASGRSRCTAASASRGSTRCIATTSARSGCRACTGTAASCARRSPHPCCPRNRRVVGHRRGVCDLSARARLDGLRARCGTPARRRTGRTELVFDVTDAVAVARAAATLDELDAIVAERGDRDRGAARVPAAGGADAPARRERRRPVARPAGVPACAAASGGAASC